MPCGTLELTCYLLSIIRIIYPRSSIVKEKINKCFEDKNIEVIVKYEVDKADRIADLVRDNIGIGFSGKEYVNNYLQKKEFIILNEIEFEKSYTYLATLKKEMCNKATVELANRIKNKYIKGM